MPKHEVPVVRISYAYKTIEVEAASREEANALALEQAGSEEFHEHESEYKLADELDN